MFRCFRFRLYPTAAQEEALGRMLEAFCDLYNAALQERIDCHQKTGNSLSYNKQALQLKEVREIDDRLATFSFTAEQQLLRRLDKAFNAFFARVQRGEKPGFPRYKAKHRFHSAEMRVGDGLSIKHDRLRIVGVPELIRVRWHRTLPCEAKLGRAIIKRQGNKWHVCFTVETPDVEAIRADFSPVGIDAGIANLVALSTGELIPNPKWTKFGDAKLRRLNRALSRKKRNSRGWKKAKNSIQQHSARIAARRLDFLHKLSTKLVKAHSHIAIEDLNVQEMSRGKLAKDVMSAGWATFFTMIRYKAESAGSVVESVDPRGTSQSCPACGGFVMKTLADRWHLCPHCGHEADRDVAAAQVILSRASFMGPGIGLDARSMPVAARLASEVSASSRQTFTR